MKHLKIFWRGCKAMCPMFAGMAAILFLLVISKWTFTTPLITISIAVAVVAVFVIYKIGENES